MPEASAVLVRNARRPTGSMGWFMEEEGCGSGGFLRFLDQEAFGVGDADYGISALWRR
jgi:hypothetical protein